MQLQKDRLTNIMHSKLKTISLRDKAMAEVSGPQLVMAPDNNGRQAAQVGWQITVWLEHDKLIGQDPVGVTVGVGGLLPPALVFERGAEFLLDEARKQRDKANTPELPLESPGLPAPAAFNPRELPTRGEVQSVRERESHFS